MYRVRVYSNDGTYVEQSADQVYVASVAFERPHHYPAPPVVLCASTITVVADDVALVRVERVGD